MDTSQDSIRFELAPDNRGASNDELLNDLRRVANVTNGTSLTQAAYEAHGRYSAATFKKRFGRWNAALALAGLRASKLMNVSRDECIADLLLVAEANQTPFLTRDTYRPIGKYSEAVFVRCFGSWSNALKAAGLAVSPLGIRIESDEQCFAVIESIWRRLGRQPKQEEVCRPNGPFSKNAITRRFGSWRKSLELFIRHVNGDTTIESSESNVATVPVQVTTTAIVRKTSRGVSWRLRFLVMRRDHFRCCNCGATPSSRPGTELVIDHVIPWAKGGETIFSNLQTLCKICNGGKSDLFAEAMDGASTISAAVAAADPSP